MSFEVVELKSKLCLWNRPHIAHFGKQWHLAARCQRCSFGPELQKSMNQRTIPLNVCRKNIVERTTIPPVEHSSMYTATLFDVRNLQV